MVLTNIGQHLNEVIAKLQRNTFVCLHCGSKAEFHGNKHVPIVPCNECGETKWKIYAIEDTVIYP